MPRIFLSHATADADIGKELKSDLENRVQGAELFLSSDPTDLPPGAVWSAAIQEALSKSEALLLLVTSRSLGRPWVWFEVGTAWFRVTVIPMCLGEPRKNALISPLSERQAVNIDSVEDVRSLVVQIGRLLKRPVSLGGIDTLVSKLQELDGRARQRVGDSGWAGTGWDGRFLAYSGPLEAMRLIEDEILHPDMVKALGAAGYRARRARIDKLSHHATKGYRVVYLTDRKSWRRRIVDGNDPLIARPLKAGEAL